MLRFIFNSIAGFIPVKEILFLPNDGRNSNYGRDWRDETHIKRERERERRGKRILSFGYVIRLRIYCYFLRYFLC